LPHPLRSLRNRLTLIFALIVAGAIAIVYFYVTPRLEDELVTQKLERLADEAKADVSPLSRIVGDPNVSGDEISRATVNAATRASAEVTTLQVSRNLEQLSRVAVSNPGGVPFDIDELADEAIRTGKAVTATQQTDVGRQALAAQPLIRGDRIRGVAIFADSLSDVEANVTLIRGRILAAGALALILAAIAGYFAARALTGRIKRLERAARKVAGGDFSNPIHADSDDEIGQLAVAFDDMQRQLARLDTARKQFIAQASHELRTPIFSLGGFLELLEDEELDDETRAQFLVQLRGQVERLRKLSTELLDLSRLESGALELRPEPTDLRQLAREVAAEFTPAAQRHRADVELQLAGEPIEPECDPERVAQVLRILLDNALVHTPAGTGVWVSADRRNGHVRLEVSDKGVGIKRQNMPHIFEPFFTSNEQAQGAGLGLAIARELAERMQGELTVRSMPGSTTFSLVLPG
jgi:two-component system OmpR family sensor kinase